MLVCVVLVFAPSASASSFALELAPLPVSTFGDTIALHGRVTPALVDAPVTILRDGNAIGTARTSGDGTFVFRTRVEGPAVYAASAGELASPTVALAARPRLVARVVGPGVVGGRLRLEARVQPAGSLHVEIRRGRRVTLSKTYEGRARIGLSTHAPGSFRVRVSVDAAGSWLGAARTLTASAVEPRLELGSRGPSVRALERRLQELRFVLPRVDSLFGLDTYQAVLAFQKLNRLPWSGRTDARFWRALSRAQVPRPRYGGDHIEVSKGRQYLLVVRGGEVRAVVHVSTGATGNTPIGRWQVYRKVTGWDWVLWYPMYFLRGFAIHGYPSVPAYPASHGCVRVPMWVAPQLYAETGWGQTIYVYW